MRKSHRKTIIASLATVALASGCAQLLGFDSVTEQGAPADAAPEIEADADTRFVCADSNFEPALGSVVVTTDTGADTIALSCGSEGSPERFLAWKAPVSDYFIFDTAGSAFDTVLGLFDECEGTELECNNNVGEGTSSEIVIKLAKDRELLIAADGFAGDQGEGVVNVERVSCPDSDLEDQSFPIGLSTQSFGDDQNSSCGGEGQEDRAYHWVAPNDGLFAFRASSETFTPIISLQEGPQCSDTELACNRSSGPGRRAEVVRRLVKDQTVSISVDGADGAGSFELDVSDLGDVSCPEQAFPLEPDSVGTFTPRTMSGSCGFPEITGLFGGTDMAGDVTYTFPVPALGQGCNGSCTIDIESEGPLFAYALDQDDCGGEEIACEVGVFNNATNLFETTLTLPGRVEAQSLTVVIASQDVRFKTFTFSAQCAVVC